MSRRRALAFLVSLLLACGSAYGASLVAEFKPVTAAEGLFFGLAHPVSELDHLGVLIGGATIALMIERSLRLPLVLLIASFAGIRLRALGIDQPTIELLMAISVFGCGLVLVTGWSRSRTALTIGFAAAGVAHGLAYAEHIEASAGPTFAAALLGLALSQAAMLAAVFYAGRGFASRGPDAAIGLYETVGGYVLMAGTITFLIAAA